MKKQISVVIAIAVLMLSTFAALKLAYAQVPSIELREPDIVNPPPGATGTFFDVEVWLNYALGVAAWEAVVYWDPSVMTRFRVTFENTMGGDLDNFTKGSMGGESLRLGQLRTDGGTYTGVAGHVATIEMILKYPGASRIYIFNSTLLNIGLMPITHNTIESTVKSTYPAPIFYWYATEPDGTTPASALPEHYLKDDCQEIQVYKIIWFDASASYDVSNLVYNEITHEWELVGGKDIVEYMWWFGDGKQSNDIRLYHGTLPRGVVVRAADPDVCRPLIPFLPSEKHDETVMPNGLYDGIGVGAAPAWEGVYNDTDKSGNVTIGDFRYTPASLDWLSPPPLMASTPVMPGDRDIGRPLVNFKYDIVTNIYEKHTEGWYSYPGVSEALMPGNVNGKYDDWEHIYRDMQFFKDEGHSHVSVGTELIDHVFEAYNYDGWEVILRVYDSEGEYWQTNWKFGGTSAGNLVKLWRDVAVVSIWPSVDWWDNTEYEPEFGVEMQILVTAVNYGTVHEWVKVCLYAIYECDKVDYHSTPSFGYDKIKIMDGWLLKTWKVKIMAGAGSGWSLYVVWTPPKVGFYKFLATVEIMDAVSQDQNPMNNYFFLSAVVDNIGDPTTYAGFMCDLDGSGKVGPRDFFIFARRYGATVPPNP